MKKQEESSPLEDVQERKDQETLNQQALGNTAAANPDSETDQMNLPKTTGTGSIPPAAAPSSLIVHEDEEGEDRYEVGDEQREEE